MHETDLNNTLLTPTLPGKATVMAVDDEPINLFLLEDIIEDRYELILLNNGTECLQAIANSLPDLILLDINMPGLSGFEVCEQLKSNPHTAETPIIFLTAMLSVDDERRGLQMGAVDYITKPFTESILLARIETQLALFQAQKVIQANHRALQKEQEYIEKIITSMREDPRFEETNIKQSLSPLDKANGDIVLSSSNVKNHQHIMVGDFTGHGLTAAIAGPLVTSIFYSNVKNSFRPADIMQMINYELFYKLPSQKFLAATYIEWQKDSKMLTVFNHGMPAAVLFKKHNVNNPVMIKSAALPLGILEDMEPYNGRDLYFEEGDRLLVFTDGVIDPRNLNECFSDENSFIKFLQNKIQKLNFDDYVLQDLLDELNQIDGVDDVTVIELKASY